MKIPLDVTRLLIEIVLTVAVAELLVSAIISDPGTANAIGASAILNAVLLSLLAGPIIHRRVRAAIRRAGLAGDGGLWAGWRPGAVALAVLLAGLGITAAAAHGARLSARQVARADFDRLTERLSEEIERRVNCTRDGLAGARGLFAASRSVERVEFDAFVASRDLAGDFPGAIGFGFIERVERPDVPAFIARQRADGVPGFRIHGLAEPGSALAAAADHYVISYCFPRERNASAWGLDVGSEANRRAAAERAMTTGEASISGRITLVQDGKRQTAFLYYLPVYRNGTAPTTPAERQASLHGLVYAPIILAESIEGVAEAIEGKLDFTIIDGLAGGGDDTTLHESKGHRDGATGSPASQPDRMFAASTRMQVGGHIWSVQTSTTPAFEAGVDHATPIVLAGGGSLLSLLAAGFTFSLLTGRTRSIRLAHEMTRDLAEATRLAEEAMRESAAFRETLDQHSIISVADRSGRIIDANVQFCRISGFTLDEILGQDHRMLNSGIHPKAFWVDVWRTLASGRAWRGEVCNRAKDGSLYWVDSVIAPFKNADGTIEKYVSIRSDVTQRKQGEAEVQRIADRLELATRAAGVGIWDFDLAEGRVTWDEQMFRLYGREADLGDETFAALDAWRAGLHPDDRGRVEGEMAEAIAGVSPFDTEFRIVHPDGTERSVRAIAILQRDEGGEPMRMVGTNWDVTAQRESAEQLEATTASLEEAQAVAQIGNWTHDLASGRLTWSRQMHALFNRDAAEGPPSFEGVLEDFDEESARRLSQAVHRAAADGTPYSLVLRTNPARGPERFVRGEGRARLDADGVVVGLFGTAMDVTAEIRGAESLREAQREAEAANLAKSAFLANMSHEIRTPLTAILGFAELLRDDGAAADSPEERAQSVATILAAGQHLLTVINDILDLSKIEADRMTVEQIETPLVAILGEVESLMRPRASGKGLKFETVLETPVPDRIVGDPTRLRQILMNLVGNAVKFTETGGVCVAVSVRPSGPVTGGDGNGDGDGDGASDGEPSVAGGRLVIDVRDTGAGLRPEQAERLFQAFGQANETVTRRHGGTGLGLTICRRLAALLGGTVTLHDTEPGRGSVFRVELPLDVVPGAVMVEAMDAAFAEDPPGTASATRGGRNEVGTKTVLAGRLLLAEDGPDNQRLISFHLRKAGADVDVADNGVIALEMIERAEAEGRPYDLLLTDMQMPEMDGYTLTRTLRKLGRTLPIVAITANAMAEDRTRCEAAGCDDYASKPIDRVAMIQTCERWLGAAGHRSRRSAA